MFGPSNRDFLSFLIPIGFIVVACGAVFGFAGYRFGIYEASERFYKNCQGGELFMSDPSSPEAEKTPVVGCAEIARRIR